MRASVKEDGGWRTSYRKVEPEKADLRRAVAKLQRKNVHFAHLHLPKAERTMPSASCPEAQRSKALRAQKEEQLYAAVRARSRGGAEGTAR